MLLDVSILPNLIVLSIRFALNQSCCLVPNVGGPAPADTRGMMKALIGCFLAARGRSKSINSSFLNKAAIALFLLLCPMPLMAQLSTSEERGLPANSAFSGGDIDSVNLQNGNLHISIPIFSAKQRGGGTLSWSFVYDTQAWIETYHPYCPSTTLLSMSATPNDLPGGCLPTEGTNVVTPESNVAAGWRLTNPFNWKVISSLGTTSPNGNPCPINSSVTSYNSITGWAVIDPQGTQHPLPIRQEVGGSCYGQTLAGPTLDGSGMYFNAQTGTLTLKNGTQVQLTQTLLGQFQGGPQVDPNGNQADPNDTMNRPLVVTDDVGTATYTSPLGATYTGPAYSTYTVQDSNGNSQVYRVDYQAIDMSPDFCSSWSPPFPARTCNVDEGSSSMFLVPRQLTLPNEKAYVFTYLNNSAGEIQSITLPTGATISYTYTNYDQRHTSISSSYATVTGGRAVTRRMETVSGISNTWTYTIGGSQTSVTDPLGNITIHNWAVMPPINDSVSLTIYEISTQYYNSSNQLLRQVTNTYTDEYDPVNNSLANVRPITQTTTLDNGQVSEKDTQYETFTYPCYALACPGVATRMNPTQVTEYDYGSGARGALLRTTATAYQAFTIGGTTVTKPQTITVTDGSGTQVAKTVYEYDNYSHPNQAMQASGAVQHNASYGTSYTNRGNVTAISKWRNTDGALLATTNQYDDAGNLLSVVDPMSYKTSYDYTDSWANSTCAPSGQSKLYRTTITNAKGQIKTSTFNSCTGKVASTTDSNGKTTNLTYDLLNRVKQVSYPDGGQTTYCYSDDPNGSCYNETTWSATKTDKISASLSVTTENIYDGLGRTIHSELVSDPEGTVTTDTLYDGDGRVSQVSNPYRSGDTEYWTTTTYDGLGRVVAVTEQDNSSTSTTYSGNTTTITDEAGKQRKSQTDALGRLTAVWENPSGLNYETDYSYDELGDLIKAVQKGGSSNSAEWRTRTFAYNSLGQLLCSANPEITSPLSSPATCPNPDSGSYTAGTIRYAYDNDGNVVSRIAPKENQQGTATVTSSYTYDSLNRLTGASYNDGTAPVTYLYDGGTVSGCTLPTTSPAPTNLIQRMSGMCDASGATAWSYDPLGRTLAEARRIGSVTDQISYGYTLNGVANSVTYPLSGGTTPLTLTYNVNAAGRINSVAIGSTTYAQVESTWATGVPHIYQYGSNIQFTDTYNSRLQPLTLSAAQISQNNTLFSKTYNFNAGSSTTPGTDNGTLASVTDALDALGLSRPNGSVNYTYDAMNRVTSAKTLGSECTAVNGGTLNCGESFTIDAWGNLTGKTPTLCSAESLSSSVTALNQLQAATYDSAGNVIDYNGASYTYDAEGRTTTAAGVAYTYDGSGQRVSKPGKLYWLGSSSAPLAETSATDTIPTQYIFFGGKRIARIDPGATTPKYYVADNLGSTALVTDYQGNKLSESEYYPYGGEQQVLTGDSNTYKFTGKERDTETGNDYFGARYYSSNIGRFLSPDWDAKPTAVPYASFGDPQTLNLYAYVENAPLNRVDADGHDGEPDAGGVKNNWLATPYDLPACGAGSITAPACTDAINSADLGSAGNVEEANAEAQYSAMVDETTQEAEAAAENTDAAQDSNSSDSSTSAQQQTTENVSATGQAPAPTNSSGHPIDKDAITNYADQHAEPHSLGKCAAYCRRAFEAGGVDTSGHPIDAKDWGPTLLKNGAAVISPDGYTPQKADVAVFAGSDAHPYGHITIYDGKQWVSDFKQRNMSPYRSGTTPATIYRFPDN